MTIDELVATGEQLAKPSLLLSPEPTSLAPIAYWGGAPIAGYKGRPDDRHRVSFDCDWLNCAGLKVSGTIGLYTVDRKWKWAKPIHVDHRPAKHFDASEYSGGRPLYGVGRRSFPPLEAVCLYGEEPVAEWLRENGWGRTDYDVAAGSDLGRAYQREWTARSPLYATEWAAVLGGWHMQWPDDDFYMPTEMQLVCWTFWESEPWIELW